MDFNKFPLPSGGVWRRHLAEDHGLRTKAWEMDDANGEHGSTVAGLAPEEEREKKNKKNGKMRRPDGRRAQEAASFRQE